MTTQSDWEFRAEFLDDQARFLEGKSEDLMSESIRYKGLAEQARYVARTMDTPALTSKEG